MPEVSFLVPVLNIEETLDATLQRLRDAFPPAEAEILVVIDVTRPELLPEVERRRRELAERFGARSLVRVEERGFGSALCYAAQEAEGEAVVPIMADLSDDIAALPAMLAKLGAGADVVAGARYAPGGTIVGDTPKQRLSRMYSKLFGLFTEVGCADVSNSFKVYRRSVWASVRPRAASFDLSVELVVKAAALGYRIDQVPTTWVNRQVGSSSFVLLRELRNYGRWLLYGVTHLPSRVAVIMGLGLPLLARRLVARPAPPVEAAPPGRRQS